MKSEQTEAMSMAEQDMDAVADQAILDYSAARASAAMEAIFDELEMAAMEAMNKLEVACIDKAIEEYAFSLGFVIEMSTV